MAQSIPTRRALIGGAGVAAVAVAIPAVASFTPAAGTVLFAQRLAEWNEAHARFLHAANVVLAEDKFVNDLCGQAGAAYRALLATPAPDTTAILQKLVAMCAWCEDCAVVQAEVEALGREASALLTNTGEA